MLLFKMDRGGSGGITSGRLDPHGIPDELNRISRLYQGGVALTNGCFDVLHPGHIACLDDIADLYPTVGLVVAVNDDDSVRRLKGDGRPIIKHYDRAYSIARLRMVEAVLVFDGDVELLVRAVRPNVLAKGGDYANEKIAGADFVESYGGRIFIASHVLAYSSSRILRGRASPFA